MTRKAKLVHRETGEHTTGIQYLEGMHPPPQGVKVTMGMQGVVARATTRDGEHCRLLDGDWILDTPYGTSICTDTFVRAEYFKEGEEPIAKVKPAKLG